MDSLPNEHVKLKIALQSDRSEEVTEIIERMPSTFGLAITGIIFFIFCLIGIFGTVARYPDIASGQITVNSDISPVKLVANANGKLKLSKLKSLDNVKEGQLIAYVENSTTPFVIDSVKKLLEENNPTTTGVRVINDHFPKNISLGELNIKYYAFVNAVQRFLNYKEDHLYDQQKQSFNSISKEQQNVISNTKNQLQIAKNSLDYVYKFYKRDSTLYKKKVISEAELDQTEISYLNARDRVQSINNAVTMANQAIQETKSKLQQLHVEDPEKGKELQLTLLSSYSDLLDNIKSWNQKYVFRAPYSGKLQYLKFYHENHFVQTGESVFSVVPRNNTPRGQVVLPTDGAGKVKVGQEVIVKLDNFPFKEYGSIEGRVKTISLVTNIQKTQNGDVETYQVMVDFPKGLKTNYGSQLDFKYESKGIAEIITNDRKLIERLFDNLKYAMTK
jgi:multidrug efflux pump subunit AcrA (membrane-fusion protein)